MSEMKACIAAARAAGEIQKKYFLKNVKIKTKQDMTPVTEADIKSEKRIIETLQKKYDYSILSEEAGFLEKRTDKKWIIDPLDGTKQFIRKIPFFGPSIALEKDGRIVLGCIHLPILGIMVSAEKRKGTFYNGMRVKVSKTRRIKDTYICVSNVKKILEKNYMEEYISLARDVQTVRGFGDIYAYSLLCKGSIDALIDPHLSPWDIAAAKIIVEEAGGMLTDFSGRDTIYGGNCIASNGILHRDLVGIMNKK